MNALLPLVAIGCAAYPTGSRSMRDAPAAKVIETDDLSTNVCEGPEPDDTIFLAMGAYASIDIVHLPRADNVILSAHLGMQNQSLASGWPTAEDLSYYGTPRLLFLTASLGTMFPLGDDPGDQTTTEPCNEDECGGEWYSSFNFATTMDGDYLTGASSGIPGRENFVPSTLCISLLTPDRLAGVIQLDFQDTYYYDSEFPDHVWYAFDTAKEGRFDRCSEHWDWWGIDGDDSDADYHRADILSAMNFSYTGPPVAIWGPSSSDTGADSGVAP